MTELVIELPESLDRELSKVAKRSQTSKTNLAKRALREFLKRQANEKEQTKTVAEVAGHLFGAIDVEGPKDLSTNKEYFEDFGK